MTVDELKALPIGTAVHWVIGPPGAERRLQAKVVKQRRDQTHVLVYFEDEPQQKKRWRHTTNQPVHESRGHVGRVKLERIFHP